MNSPSVTSVTVRDMCVTCHGHRYRDERDSSLQAVTGVTLAEIDADLVPIPPFRLGVRTGDRTVSFSLPNSGKGC